MFYNENHALNQISLIRSFRLNIRLDKVRVEIARRNVHPFVFIKEKLHQPVQTSRIWFDIVSTFSHSNCSFTFFEEETDTHKKSSYIQENLICNWINEFMPLKQFTVRLPTTQDFQTIVQSSS